MGTKLGKCLLCGKERVLLLSHVIPAFVHRWHRESSGTGHIRSTLNPNRRIQDGPKHYWLCSDCEALIGRSETAFANQIFFPYLAQSAGHYQYSRWLLHFCTSISWRVLHHFLSLENLTEDTSTRDQIAEAERTWRALLLGRQPHPGVFEQHLLPLDQISGGRLGPATSINRYLMRVVHMDIWLSPEVITYAKLGRFMIFGFINVANRKDWHGTRVTNSGEIRPRRFAIPEMVAEYWNRQADEIQTRHRSISQRQKEKVSAAFRANMDRFAESDAFRALKADVDMFGTQAFGTDSPDD